jgi:transposase
VGADRAVVAGVADALAGTASSTGPGVPARDSVRAAHRHQLAGPAIRTGFGSGMTCWRRLRRWADAGVFDRLHRLLLGELNATGHIDRSRAVMDDSYIDAKKGVLASGRRRSTAASRAASTT